MRINPWTRDNVSLSYLAPLRIIAFIALISAFPVINQACAADTPAGGNAPPPAKRAGKALSYRIATTDRRAYNYDARPEIQGYAQLVAERYRVALDAGLRLKAAIDALLAEPGEATLTRARDSWINARRSYEETEAFRFYDGPIDIEDTETGEPGPLERLDGWPVDPAAIDYVEDNPTAGIVNDMKAALTRRTLLDREAADGQGHAVTTGWHAIEFLLWGQETSAGDPGDRPASDFVAGQPNNDRRRAYLKLVSDMLIDDLRYLVDSWEPSKKPNYGASFKLINQREALGRIMNGIGRLAGEELPTNRLAAALDSRDRKLLTSHFSGMSYQDLIFALRGVRNVWTGDHDEETEPGLEDLIGRVDPVLAQRITHALNHAEAAIAALQTPLEREMLPAPQDSPARENAERAIADLKKLANLIRDAAAKLGVAVFLPS
jgi:putative iron-regulated protein